MNSSSWGQTNSVSASSKCFNSGKTGKGLNLGWWFGLEPVLAALWSSAFAGGICVDDISL